MNVVHKLPVVAIVFDQCALYCDEQEKSEEIARTEVLDTGKPIWESRFDILNCADVLQFYGGLASSVVGICLFYVMLYSGKQYNAKKFQI